MLKINEQEILTVIEGLTWSGAKDAISRELSFSFLYNPQKPDIPKYQVKTGDRVEWAEGGKTLFLGYVENIDYTTDDDTIHIRCKDLLNRLKSKCAGRFQGTLNQLANNICGTFGIKNGINVSQTHIHNIISKGDKTYYDILNIACKTMYERFNLYMDADTLKLAEHNAVNTFTIGRNIRSSAFSQSIEQMVNKILIVDSEGNLKGSVQNSSDLKQYGLFQETYSYNEDINNNSQEATKELKTVENTSHIIVDNDYNCISGRFIKVFEPVNNFIGLFEIQSDTHTIGADKSMDLVINYVG